MPDQSPCRSCRKPVLWARTAATGKPMPREEDAERGNVLIDEMGKAHAFKDHKAAMAELEGEPERWSTVTYLSHHASCPAGQAWKGKQRTDADAPRSPEQEAMF